MRSWRGSSDELPSYALFPFLLVALGLSEEFIDMAVHVHHDFIDGRVDVLVQVSLAGSIARRRLWLCQFVEREDAAEYEDGCSHDNKQGAGGIAVIPGPCVKDIHDSPKHRR